MTIWTNQIADADVSINLIGHAIGEPNALQVSQPEIHCNTSTIPITHHMTCWCHIVWTQQKSLHSETPKLINLNNNRIVERLLC